MEVTSTSRTSAAAPPTRAKQIAASAILLGLLSMLGYCVFYAMLGVPVSWPRKD